MALDWLKDPTPDIEIEPSTPRSTALVTAVLGGGLYTVDFRGQTRTARGAGPTLAVGDGCTFVDMRPTAWVINESGEYPTRWRKPLTMWESHAPASLFLRLLLENNPRSYTYRQGTAVSAVSASVLRVSCWDNAVRDLDVEYAGTAAAASAFTTGDAVLVFMKAQNTPVVVGGLVGAFGREDGYEAGTATYVSLYKPISCTDMGGGTWRIETDVSLDNAGANLSLFLYYLPTTAETSITIDLHVNGAFVVTRTASLSSRSYINLINYDQTETVRVAAPHKTTSGSVNFGNVVSPGDNIWLDITVGTDLGAEISKYPTIPPGAMPSWVPENLYIIFGH